MNEEEYEECSNCDGLGRIDDLSFDDEENEDFEDYLSAINIVCPACNGKGYLDKDD